MKKKLAIIFLFSIFVTDVIYTIQKRKVESSITVYHSRTCGCCKKWTKHLSENQFRVDSIIVGDISEIKSKFNIPTNLSSCHTAIIDGYLVEGHVPAQAILKLIRERPEYIGISVPGMPIGSPGMEGPLVEKYDVIAFDKSGNEKVFMKF